MSTFGATASVRGPQQTAPTTSPKVLLEEYVSDGKVVRVEKQCNDTVVVFHAREIEKSMLLYPQAFQQLCRCIRHYFGEPLTIQLCASSAGEYMIYDEGEVVPSMDIRNATFRLTICHLSDINHRYAFIEPSAVQDDPWVVDLRRYFIPPDDIQRGYKATSMGLCLTRNEWNRMVKHVFPQIESILNVPDEGKQMEDFEQNEKIWERLSRTARESVYKMLEYSNMSPPMQCALCSLVCPTLEHILNRCAKSLETRFYYRHDTVLQELFDFIKSKHMEQYQMPGSHWTYYADLPFHKATEEPYDDIIYNVTSSRKRPDILMINREELEICMGEVTICYNTVDSMTSAEVRKTTRYCPLIEELQSKRYCVKFATFEVGSLGHSRWGSMKKSLYSFGIEVTDAEMTNLQLKLADTAIRCSREIFENRRNSAWLQV